MVQKKRKSKTSSVKRGNQLRTKLLKQGKLKVKRHRAKTKRLTKSTPTVNVQSNIHEQDSDNEFDMIEQEDIKFLQKSVRNKSYSMFNHLNLKSKEEKHKTKKRKADDDEDDDLVKLESQYEQSVQHPHEAKKKKYLLPIKTQQGIVIKSEEIQGSEEEEEEEEDDDNKLEEAILDGSEGKKSEVLNEIVIKESVSSADLLACRQNSLMKKKFRIGILCSGLTENPELKIKNFKPLLEMLDENDPEVCLTVRKIVLMSLLEVFKDLIPGYQIKHHNDPKVKLKKAVKQLYSYENDLLKYYKEYLKKIEQMVSILKRKRGDTRVFKEPEQNLAEMALKCFCELLTNHPYFNLSKNIIHLLIPFLNNGKERVRTIVSSAVKEVFKTDKRGEISLEIVRKINKLVKSKANIVYSEVLSVFLSLKLKDVNLDKEKEDELKKKKEMAKKQKFLKMSKRERKKKKRFENLEKELLETKAEENKKYKEQHMTEITKILFTIYFRILKVTPSSKLLNAALEGLAKFAHCINVDFYQDLIIVLDNLILNENLGYKEKLCCVQTVFTVLFYQGATICIDPIRFYSHFYANILEINGGKNHSDLPVVLKTTDFVLLKRRKHVSLQRLLAFTKRLTTLMLQVLPNGCLALLSSVRQILQVNNSTDILLDLDSSVGQGVYFPELDEPEYCNASATSLWELLPLQRHYHPMVRKSAEHLAKNEQSEQDAIHSRIFLKQSPEQLFEDYDASNMRFNPAVDKPKPFPKRKTQGILNQELEDYVKGIFQKKFDF